MSVIIQLFLMTHWERQRKRKDFYSWKVFHIFLFRLLFESFRISCNYVCEKFSLHFFVYLTKEIIRKKYRIKNNIPEIASPFSFIIEYVFIFKYQADKHRLR
jgi:hypothetical protein